MKNGLRYILFGFIIAGLVACADNPAPADGSNPIHNSKEDAGISEPAENDSLFDTFDLTQDVLNIQLHTELPNDLPKEDHAFVVLGSSLSEDGKIQETLRNRLKVAFNAAERYPHSTIIVTGGVPKKGITEAGAMYDWLVAHGIDQSRIIKEDAATDTVDNASFSLAIANKENIEDITLITSASHMRRALAVFNEVNRNFEDNTDRQFSHVVYMDFDNPEDAANVTFKEKALIYRDLIRASST